MLSRVCISELAQESAVISEGFERFCCLSARLIHPCRSASSVSLSSNRPSGSYTARLLMEIANGWEQAVRNASNAVARVRPDGIPVLLELLEEIKSVPLWKF